MARDESALTGLAEAIAWWKMDLANGRVVLALAATNAVVCGMDGPAVAELAGIPPDENPFVVDELVERVGAELDLDQTQWVNADRFVVRRLCRGVLKGELSEHQLTDWVHMQFHHESNDQYLDYLAELDDEWDDAVYVNADTTEIAKRIRDTAALILDRTASWHPEESRPGNRS